MFILIKKSYKSRNLKLQTANSSERILQQSYLIFEAVRCTWRSFRLYINNLENQRSGKVTVILENLKNLSSCFKIIRLFVKKTKTVVYKPLTRAPRYILIKSFCQGIGWSYLQYLSPRF